MNPIDVLIIDDNEICCLMLKQRLELIGLTVNYVLDGNQAIYFIQQSHPKLIILDIFMPDKDGFEIMTELRKESSNPYIIAISSAPDWLDCMKQMGANKTYFKRDIESLTQGVSHYFMIS